MSLFDTIDIDAALLPVMPSDGLFLPTGGWQTTDLGDSMLVFRLTAAGVLEEPIYGPTVTLPPDGTGLPAFHAPILGWRQSLWGGHVTAGHCVRDTHARLPAFPEARLEYSVDIACTIVGGQVVGPITIVACRPRWEEPADGGWIALETDPERRAMRQEQWRLRDLQRELAAMRASPSRQLRHLLRQHLTGKAMHQACRLMHRLETERNRPRRPWSFYEERSRVRGLQGMIEAMEIATPPR